MGTPATVVALVALMLWAMAVLTPGDYLCRTVVPVRVVMGLLVGTIFLGYAVLHVRHVPGAELLSSDRALLQVLSWAGVGLLAAEGLRDRGELYRVLRTLVAAVAVMAVVGLLQFRSGIDLAELANHIPGLHENADLVSIQDRVGLPSTGRHGHPSDRVRVRHRHGAAPRSAPGSLRPGSFAIPPVAASGRDRHRDPRCGVALRGSGGGGCRRRDLRWAGTEAAASRIGGGGGLHRGDLCHDTRTSRHPPLPVRQRRVGFEHHYRTDDYEAVGEYIRQSPWLGRGPGTFLADSDNNRVLDNQYLLSAIEIGLVGLSVVIGYLLATAFLGRGARHRSTDPAIRDLGQALAATSLASAVTAFTFDGFSFLMFAGFIPLCLGVAGAVWMMERTAERRIRVERPLEVEWWDPPQRGATG